MTICDQECEQNSQKVATREKGPKPKICETRPSIQVLCRQPLKKCRQVSDIEIEQNAWS